MVVLKLARVLRIAGKVLSLIILHKFRAVYDTTKKVFPLKISFKCVLSLLVLRIIFLCAFFK